MIMGVERHPAAGTYLFGFDSVFVRVLLFTAQNAGDSVFQKESLWLLLDIPMLARWISGVFPMYPALRGWYGE